MKWSEKEIKETINLLKEGKTYIEISEITGRPKNAIRVRMGKLGEGYEKYNPTEIKTCLNCNDVIENYGKKFCSRSCSATFNNKTRVKVNDKIIMVRDERKRKEYHKRKKNNCVNCGELANNKYCSLICQNNYKRKLIFEKIENGDTTLDFRQYKKYLIYKYGAKCMKCGWNEVNPTSGKVPIELEHKDGNSTNNSLDNLELLCPNCHSLTPTYKALNKGNGRHSRMDRYHEGKSY